MWGLGWQARWTVDEASAVCYRVGVGTAVAERAAYASLTWGSHRALAWSSVAPDLCFTAAASRLPTLVLAAVRATASCRHSRREDDYYPSVI